MTEQAASTYQVVELMCLCGHPVIVTDTKKGEIVICTECHERWQKMHDSTTVFTNVIWDGPTVECEVEPSSGWVHQFQCSIHGVIFRDELHGERGPAFCPAGRSYKEGYEEAQAEAVNRGKP